MNSATTLIIGVGNRFRRDDAVGPLAADRLAEAGLNAIEASGEGAGLIDLWDGQDRVIVIDASQSGAAPGTIHRFDATAAEIPKQHFRYSSHLFGVAEAVEMARLLDRLPRQLLIFGIEGSDFTHGTEPTAPVAAAMDTVIDEVRSLTP